MRPLYISQTQVQNILDSIDISNNWGVRAYAIIGFLYATGAKVGEFRNLINNDLMRNSVLIVNRLLPLGLGTLSSLKRYLTCRPYPNGDNLFLTIHGNPIPDNKSVRRIVQNRSYKAGLQIVPSTLRNSFIVHMLEAGVSFGDVQYLSGVKNVDILKNKYVWLKRQRLI